MPVTISTPDLTTLPPVPAAGPDPHHAAHDVGSADIFGLSFRELADELATQLRGSAELTPEELTTLELALTTIVEGQALLIADPAGPGAPRIAANLRSAMNTLNLLAAAKGFNAVAAARRMAWAVFDRALAVALAAI